MKYVPQFPEWLVAGLALGVHLPMAAQYQYIPPANPGLISTRLPREPLPSSAEVMSAEVVRSEVAPAPLFPPQQQRIPDFSAAGDYQSAGTEGLALLANEKVDDALQLVIANSLAWTGRTDEALPVYGGLVNGKYGNSAKVGIANIQRWRGMDHLAFPEYQAVLAAEPDHAGALEGLELATRELVPRTQFSAGGLADSSSTERRSASVNHRWRDRSGARVMELEISGVQDTLPGLLSTQDEVLLRYQALDLQLKPSLELSMPTRDNPKVFGDVRLSSESYKTTVEIGRVNWGKSAINPKALAAQLSANHGSASVTRSLPVGDLTGRVDLFDISDGNRVTTSSLRLASSWRPVGSQVKPFFGIETRDSSFNSPNYWSPQQGFGTVYAGVLAEWGRADWSLYVSGQAGAPLYGEAGNSWSLSGGGKQWISNNVAISLNLWAMSSRRDNAQYESQAATISLDKLWR